MDQETATISQIEAIGWATPAEGVTLDSLITELETAGTKIYEIDRENNRLKVIDERVEV